MRKKYQKVDQAIAHRIISKHNPNPSAPPYSDDGTTLDRMEVDAAILDLSDPDFPWLDASCTWYWSDGTEEEVEEEVGRDEFDKEDLSLLGLEDLLELEDLYGEI